MNTLKSSTQPVTDLERLAYPGQAPNLRMYRSGYEAYMDQMPLLEPSSVAFGSHLEIAQDIMHELTNELKAASWWKDLNKEPHTFQRTILALEPPKVSAGGELVSGNEIVMGHWGVGQETPIHGHAFGFMHEEMVSGKMLVNNYRVVDAARKIVRPSGSKVYRDGVISTGYSSPDPGNRSNRVHNVKALAPTTTVHFFAEHTRDGRDNRMTAEYFEQYHPIDFKDVVPVGEKAIEQAPAGAVFLIRSFQENWEYGDHFRIIGKKGEEDIFLPAPGGWSMLDFYSEVDYGLVILLLQADTTQKLREFYNLTF